MALFAISDLHLSLGGNKPMDGFPGWKDYVQRLECGWHSTVGTDDTVVIPGDISWGMTLQEALPDFQFLNALPGKKILLKGNHDYWWTTRKKMDTFFAENKLTSLTLLHNDCVELENCAICGTRGWFYDAEADTDKTILKREIGRLHFSVDAAEATHKKLILFLHYPPMFGNTVCPEMLEAITQRGITQCWYGHIHGPGITSAVTGWVNGVEYHLISADYLKFIPRFVSSL